jgi:hypothetical protein
MRTGQSIAVLNYAVSQENDLRERHYVFNSPGHRRRWATFSPRKVAGYQTRFGNDFCLVVAGDPAIPGDFYAMPWRDVSEHFVEESKYPAPQKSGTPSLRWQIHLLANPPHTFQFELAPSDLRQRPRFDAARWFGNYVALGVPDQSSDDSVLAELIANDATFPEGGKKAVLHYRRERNPALAQKAKLRFLSKHGSLFCEVCTFKFTDSYGSHGEGFIEAHHTVPLGSLTEETETRVEDLRMVCANCHRMLHRGERWLTVAELMELVGLARNCRRNALSPNDDTCAKSE